MWQLNNARLENGAVGGYGIFIRIQMPALEHKILAVRCVQWACKMNESSVLDVDPSEGIEKATSVCHLVEANMVD